MLIYHVDSFAESLFEGNPAGVCILSGEADEGWMQKVAMELNLPETAFVYRWNEEFNLRWFSPVAEVNLCGHATLASAHVLWETKQLCVGDTAVFNTKSGKLSAIKEGELIVLDFPTEEDKPQVAPKLLEQALGAACCYVGKNRMDYIVEVDNEKTVRELKPDFEIMKKIDTRGIIVTSRSENHEFDFVSRFFAPAIGINEDPVTGSAHCCLGPYWMRQLGKNDMSGYQASIRGGTVRVTVCGDRVKLAGKAVTVYSANFVGV